jgi:hypothetical protein
MKATTQAHIQIILYFLAIFLAVGCRPKVKPMENLANQESGLDPAPQPQPTPAPQPAPQPQPQPSPVPPDLTIHSGPATLSGATTADFSFSSSTTELDHFECQRDSYPVETCTSPKHYDGVGGGHHSFRVKVIDTQGLSAEQTWSWTVDLLGPTMSLTSTPKAEETTGTATFEFSSQDQSGIAQFQCQLDSGSFASCTSPKTYSGLSGGAHTFSVRGKDGSGNVGDVVSYSWTVLVAPTYDQSFVTSNKTFSSVNGWFPKISPDGKYIGCGFSDISIVDPVSGQAWPLMSHAFWAQWIQPNVMTFLHEDDENGLLQTRYEVPMSTKIPAAMPGDPSVVAGNIFSADAGHWASFQSGASRRLTYDGVALSNDGGPAMSVSADWLVYAKNVNGKNLGLIVYKGGQRLKEYPLSGVPEAFEVNVNQGYIVYGGYGAIHGIDPSGHDIDLTITPWRWEAHAFVFFVDGQPWVASTTSYAKFDRGYILLRPWGSQDAIVLEDGDAAGLDAASVNGEIIVAMNTNTGILSVRRFKATAPRVRVVP